MVRAKINEPISHDKEILLMMNHKFFIRDVIARCAKIAIASAIFAGFCLMSDFVFSYIMKTRTFSRNAESYTTAYIMWIILATIIFLVFFCYEMHEVIIAHKEITKKETDILSGNQ